MCMYVCGQAQPIAMIVAGPIAGCLSKRFEARVLATVSQEHQCSRIALFSRFALSRY